MNDSMTPLHVLIPSKLKAKLERTKKQTGWTSAELTRKALIFYLENVQISKKKEGEK